MEVKQNYKRLPGWWWTMGVLLGLVALVAPQQLGVLIYKLLQVMIGLLVGYLADRALYKHTLPVDIVDANYYGGMRLLSRAIIVLGVLIALCVGL